MHITPNRSDWLTPSEPLSETQPPDALSRVGADGHWGLPPVPSTDRSSTLITGHDGAVRQNNAEPRLTDPALREVDTLIVGRFRTRGGTTFRSGRGEFAIEQPVNAVALGHPVAG